MKPVITKLNWSYVILCFITVTLALMSMLYAGYLVNKSHQEFCGVLKIRAIENVHRLPGDTDRDALLRQKAHEAYVLLAHQYGCIK